MKKFALKSPALALLLITILFPASVPAVSAEPVGTISAVEGRVGMLKSGNNEFSDVKPGDSVCAGDTLRTKSGSKAEIAFADKTIVRLSDSTFLEIKDYVIGPNGNRSGAGLFLSRGKIRAIVSKSGNGSFLVTTPNALGSVKGTDIVAVYQRSSTSLAVLDGKLSAANAYAPGNTVDIKSGQSSIISGESEPTVPRALLS
ncbi:MAG: FecR family protein, partial [Candidatus Omnitrophota bacterium]